MSEMLQIDDKLISLQLLEEKFCCNLDKCKGACCVQGDVGAPLLDEEALLLSDLFELIEPYLRTESVISIREQGTHVLDETDNEMVTPLINGKECAYAIFEEGIARCAIEKAWMEKKIPFRKPVSCHLYPIRVREYPNFTALNYDRWPICKPAIANGEEKDLSVYRFCRDSIERRFGEKFYNDLELASKTFVLERK